MLPEQRQPRAGQPAHTDGLPALPSGLAAAHLTPAEKLLTSQTISPASFPPESLFLPALGASTQPSLTDPSGGQPAAHSKGLFGGAAFPRPGGAASLLSSKRPGCTLYTTPVSNPSAVRLSVTRFDLLHLLIPKQISQTPSGPWALVCVAFFQSAMFRVTITLKD